MCRLAPVAGAGGKIRRRTVHIQTGVREQPAVGRRAEEDALILSFRESTHER
jgi:hypothetical protein